MFRNCLFHALSHQGYGNMDYHISVRQLDADYMEENEKIFEDFNETDLSFTEHGIFPFPFPLVITQ
jgi:hypothetical protein